MKTRENEWQNHAGAVLVAGAEKTREKDDCEKKRLISKNSCLKLEATNSLGMGILETKVDVSPDSRTLSSSHEFLINGH